MKHLFESRSAHPAESWRESFCQIASSFLLLAEPLGRSWPRGQRILSQSFCLERTQNALCLRHIWHLLSLARCYV